MWVIWELQGKLINLTETGDSSLLKQMQSLFKQGVHFSAMWCYSTDGAQNNVVTEYKGVFHKAGKQRMPSLGQTSILALLASV